MTASDSVAAVSVRAGSERRPSWLWAVAAVGILIRLRQYLSGRSLWLDEAMVANDLRERNLAGVLGSPSPREQMSPAGFWAVEEVMSTLSHTAASLRFAPLAAGIALVVLAVVYAERHLLTWPARLTLVALVSLSPALIHYSAEVKPYGVEAAVSLLLLWAVVQRHQWSTTTLTVVGVIGILFSFPGLVMVPLLAVVFALELARRDGWRAATARLWRPAVVLATAQVAAGVSALRTRAPIDDFWEQADAYAPRSGAAIGWLAETAARTARFGIYHVGIIGRPPDDALDNALWAATAGIIFLLVVTAVALAIRARRRDRTAPPVAAFLVTAGAIITILAVMVVLSALEVYPMHGRLTVYLFPLVFLLAARSVDMIGAVGFRLAAGVVAIALAVAVVPRAVDVGLDPYDRYDIIEALEWIEERAAPGDVIVYDPGTSGEAYAFHSPDFAFGELDVRFYNGLVAELALAQGEGETVWFFSAFVTARNNDWVDDLLTDERVVDSWRGDGAFVAQLDTVSA